MRDKDILIHEAQFADEHYLPYARDLSVSPVMMQKYSNPRQMWDWRQRGAALLGPVAGKKLLDLGCGMGEEMVYFAKLGALVTGIDISPVGIEIARKRAHYNNLQERITALVMAANPTSFPDHSFDLVHGVGILHHIGLREGLEEVRRLLKPGGIGVFLEPMGNSRAIDKLKILFYGGANKIDATDYEEPLQINDLRRQAYMFHKFETYPYHLTYRLRKKLPAMLYSPMQVFDYLLLKIMPWLSYFAGGIIIRLQTFERQD